MVEVEHNNSHNTEGSVSTSSEAVMQADMSIRDDSAFSDFLLKSRKFLKKYFWEGQELSTKAALKHQDKSKQNLYDRNRRLIAMLTPALIVHTIWLIYMSVNDLWHVFREESKPNAAGEGGVPQFYMSIVMIFGSMVAGATSEGGAAVAFPVMTLLFKITPTVARDFSFMIQSAGMVAASMTIFLMKVRLEYNSIILCTIGGTIGLVFGLEFIAPELPPAFSKMYFVCVFFSFAVALYLLNRNHDRKVFNKIINCWDKPYWKPIALFLFGILGGIFSSISGSGLDICSFSVLTLLFRVSEKVATPTSVVLMAINTVIGFFYREVVQNAIDESAYGFWACAIPVVVVGAPFGSLIGSHFHRLVLAALIYILDTAGLITALIVIKPWSFENTDAPLLLSLSSLAILIGGSIMYMIISKIGEYLIPFEEAKLEEKEKLKEIKLLEMGSLN